MATREWQRHTHRCSDLPTHTLALVFVVLAASLDPLYQLLRYPLTVALLIERDVGWEIASRNFAADAIGGVARDGCGDGGSLVGIGIAAAGLVNVHRRGGCERARHTHSTRTALGQSREGSRSEGGLSGGSTRVRDGSAPVPAWVAKAP